MKIDDIIGYSVVGIVGIYLFYSYGGYIAVGLMIAGAYCLWSEYDKLNRPPPPVHKHCRCCRQ